MNNIEARQQLLNSYKELKSLYSDIYKTYEEQREAFKNENEKQVQAIIDQRSELMGQVDKLMEQTQIGDEISSTDEIDELRLSIKSILQKTIDLDQSLTEEMQIALGENRQKRQGLQQGKKIFNAYNQNQSASFFIDKKK